MNNIFGNNNPFFGQRRRAPEPVEDRVKRFFKEHLVLGILLVATIAGMIYLKAGLFYGLFYGSILYFSGMFFDQFVSRKNLLIVYLAGAAFGFLFFAMMFSGMHTLFGPEHIAAMLTSAVLAVAVAVAVYSPDLKIRLFIFGGMKYMYLVLIFLFIDLIMRDFNGTHLSHLGGSVAGFLYAFFMSDRFKDNVFKPLFGKRTRKKKEKKSRYKTERDYQKRPMSDEDYNKKRADKQDRIDMILEKISKSGYDSLTKEEKELLFKQSKE